MANFYSLTFAAPGTPLAKVTKTDVKKDATAKEIDALFGKFMKPGK